MASDHKFMLIGVAAAALAIMILVKKRMLQRTWGWAPAVRLLTW
jgi:hypothetical protein